MDEQKEYMTDKNITCCTNGSLKVVVRTKGHGISKNGSLYLNANDHKSGDNIQCYGYCKCIGGICQPQTPLVWINVEEKSLIDGAPYVTLNSRLQCMHDGEIIFCDSKAYGLEEFLKDLFAGEYSSSLLADDIDNLLKRLGEKFLDFNDNKLVAGITDFGMGSTEFSVGMLGMAGALATKNRVALGIATWGTLKGASDFNNGVGEIMDYFHGTDEAHDYLKEAVSYTGAKVTPFSEDSVGFFYDISNAKPEKITTRLQALGKQKDIASVYKDIKEGAIEKVEKEGDNAVDRIIDANEKVQHINDAGKNRLSDARIQDIIRIYQ